MSVHGFDRTRIQEALTELGVRLQARGLQGDLFVVGGAAMALAYDAERFTRDVDAVFEPKMVIYELADQVAADLGLPSGWLNDSVKGFFIVQDPHEGPVFQFASLRVQAASPSHLLALKVRAARLGEDDQDVVVLARLLGLVTADEVLDHTVAVVGDRHLTARSEFFVRQVVGDAGQRS